MAGSFSAVAELPNESERTDLVKLKYQERKTLEGEIASKYVLILLRTNGLRPREDS